MAETRSKSPLRLAVACHLLAASCAALGAGSAASAQEGATPPADPTTALERTFDAPLLADVRSRLTAERPQTLAWGGYLAGEHGLHEMVPLLHDALEQLLTAGNTVEVRCARLVLLDAVCRLGADLPDELLEALDLDDQVRPALLLTIARKPAGRQPILLRWFEARHQRDTEGLYEAAGKLLAQNPSPGFVAFLLDHLQLCVDISVCDVHSRGSSRGFGGSFGSSSRHQPRIPEGWPPIAVWTFPKEPATGDVLVTPAWSDDCDPLVVRRKLTGRYLPQDRGRGAWTHDSHLLRWLERAASPPGNSTRLDSGLSISEALTIDLTHQDFDQEVARITFERKRSFERLLRGLEKRGLLPEDRPTMDDVFDIQLHDFRADRIGPLPELRWPRNAPVSASWETRERTRDGEGR